MLALCRDCSFVQDPSEIYDDYEVQIAPSKAADARLLQHQRTFAQVPRPVVEAAAAAMAAAQQQSTRKRKRPESEPTAVQATSRATLNAVARASEVFTDSFLESLIFDNAAALQGAEHSYSQRSWCGQHVLLWSFAMATRRSRSHYMLCWSSRTRLPVSRMPVANWRFVLEHAAAVSDRMRPSAGVAPPLREAYVGPSSSLIDLSQSRAETEACANTAVCVHDAGRSRAFERVSRRSMHCHGNATTTVCSARHRLTKKHQLQ